MPRARLASLLIAVVALGAAGGYLLQQRQHEGSATDGRAVVGEALPDFALRDAQGRPHSAHEWLGKVVVLNFWATWCPPCLKEIPSFVQLQKRYGSRGLQFIGIAIDDLAQVQEFMHGRDINYPVLVGNQDAIQLSERLGNALGVLPFTAIVDRQARVAHVQVGELSSRQAEQLLLPLL